MAFRNKARRLYFSAKSKQTALDTAQTVDQRIDFDVNSLPGQDIDTVNDADLLGTDDEPADSFLTAIRGSMPFAQPRVRPNTLAFVLAYFLGTAAVSTPGGATNTRKHNFTGASVSAADMDLFTMEALLETGSTEQYKDGIVNDLSLTINRGANRHVGLSGNMIFSGNRTTGSTTPGAISENPLNAGKDTGIWIGQGSTYDGTTADDLDPTANDLTGGTIVDLAGSTYKTESVTWNASNNFNPEDNYNIGGGEEMDTMRRQDRTGTVNIVFDMDDNSFITDLINNNFHALQVKIRGAEIETGFYYGLNLIFPRLKYRSLRPVNANGVVKHQAEFEVQTDSTHGPYEIDVFNIQDGAYAA